MSRHIHSLLCLGDSYTIGEGLPLYESFPYQAVQMLRNKGIAMHSPEIVAKTGWTTFELADHLINHAFEEHYDFVTLLIGVNNQYRGLRVSHYDEEFEFLLRKAVHLAGNQAGHVLALSIPDWGVTPYAENRNRQQIAREIDSFNRHAQKLCDKHGVRFVDITALQRAEGAEPAMLANDGLHPSANEYAKWATLVADWVSELARG